MWKKLNVSLLGIGMRLPSCLATDVQKKHTGRWDNNNNNNNNNTVWERNVGIRTWIHGKNLTFIYVCWSWLGPWLTQPRPTNVNMTVPVLESHSRPSLLLNELESLLWVMLVM